MGVLQSREEVSLNIFSCRKGYDTRQWQVVVRALRNSTHPHYHHRGLRDFRLPLMVLKSFYTSTIESMLTGNITIWFGNSTKRDHLALQRVVRSAERTIRCQRSDLNHPNN